MSPEQNFASQTGYSDAEMIRMQRDAIRRVREMQQRAQDFERARRASGPSAGEAVIPRPTLTGNPIGGGRVGGAPQPQAAVPSPFTEPTTAYQAPPPPTAGPTIAYQAPPPPTTGPTIAYQAPPPPPAGPVADDQPPPPPPPPSGGGAYRGAQNPGPGPQGPPGRSPQQTGGLFGNLGNLGSLFSGQGIAGIGSSINTAIGGMSEPVRDALASLGLDNERLLVLLVMFIVFTQDDYDNLLLLALGYLLL